MSIYRRPGLKYYWTKFELNGKRIHKSTKTTNLTKALQWEAALRTQMQRVLVGLERDPMKNTTLQEFRLRFLDEIRSFHTDRPETQNFYQRRYDELLAYEGFECPLSEIDEQRIDAFRTWEQSQLSRFGRSYSTVSVNRCLATLKRALRLAYRWQMIDRVPQISLLKGERQKDTVLYRECEQEFLVAAPQTRYTCALLSIDLGLRLKEYLAVRKERIRLSPAPGAPLGYVEVRAFHDPLKSHYSNRDRRGRMSAAGRARIAAAQRARWAKAKQSQASKPMRRLSAATRGKLSRLLKQRWAQGKMRPRAKRAA